MVNYSTHAQPSSSSTFSHFIRSANPASEREVIRLRSREKPHYMTSRVQQPQRDTHFAVLNLNVPSVCVYIYFYFTVVAVLRPYLCRRITAPPSSAAELFLNIKKNAALMRGLLRRWQAL